MCEQHLDCRPQGQVKEQHSNPMAHLRRYRSMDGSPGLRHGLLAQVAQDYNLDNQELLKRYLEAPAPQATIKNGDGVPAPLLVLAQQTATRKKRTPKEKPEKQCCKGITAKGQPCKFAALTDGFCKKHSEQEKKKSEGGAPQTPGPQGPELATPTCRSSARSARTRVTARPEAPEIEGAEDTRQPAEARSPRRRRPPSHLGD